MRSVLAALALLSGCAVAQERGAAPTNYAREAFDTAQETLQTRPYNFRALYATLSQVTSIQPAPTPADLDAAQKAAVRLIASPDLVFAIANKPADMTDEQWAQTKNQIQPFADQVLIAIDRLRNGGTQPVNAQLNRVPMIQGTPPQKVEAQYSEEARLAGLEGSVLVMGTVADDGSIHDLRVSRPLGLGLDEQAIAAAAQWRFQPGTPQLETFQIDFALPSKQSRWHLVGAEFKTPAGASRPTFAAADYSLGPGLSLAAYDEARLLAAIGRGASATVSFDIDERGYPGHFQVVRDSAEVWGPEAVVLVQNWRFHPGMKAGAPVSVPCTLSLVWGPEDFTSRAIAGQVAQMYQQAQPQREPPVVQLVSSTEPLYTEEARRAGVEGTVEVLLTIDEQGMPRNVRTAGSLGMGLTESAQEAISQWRFQPMVINGQSAAVEAVVRVKFRLSGVETAILSPTAAPAKPK